MFSKLFLAYMTNILFFFCVKKEIQERFLAFSVISSFANTRWGFIFLYYLLICFLGFWVSLSLLLYLEYMSLSSLSIFLSFSYYFIEQKKNIMLLKKLNRLTCSFKHNYHFLHPQPINTTESVIRPIFAPSTRPFLLPPPSFPFILPPIKSKIYAPPQILWRRPPIPSVLVPMACNNYIQVNHQLTKLPENLMIS